MSLPSSGVALGVPQTRVLSEGQFQARQFEYHPSQPWMSVGTMGGEVVVVDWDSNRTLARTHTPRAAEPNSMVLALAWLRHTQDRLLAATANGHAAMYRVNPAKMLSQEELDEAKEAALEMSSSAGGSFAAGAGSAFAASARAARSSSACGLSLVTDYRKPLAPKLTSMHVNSTDTLLVGSGYTHDCYVSDLHTGQRLRRMRNIHDGHINIARCANHSPFLLLTCSFDRTLKLFDLRCNAHVQRSGADHNAVPSPKPLYTCSSSTGNVMVCFSPNDLYFLASAVDNEVKQFLTADGRLSLAYDIPRQRSPSNYTRSYYLNGGEQIISGASSSELLYVASSVDGAVVDTLDVSEGRRERSLYVQSLRGCPLPSGQNRCAVLLCYKAHTERPYELVDVDMNRDPSGAARELPFSLGSIRALADDYRAFLAQPRFADVVISCQGAKGDQLIYAHQAVLRARWPWFNTHAQWKEEAAAATTWNSTAAAAATGTAALKPLHPASLDSLDDDEVMETQSVDASSAQAEPLTFCRIHVPHPSFESSPAVDGSNSPSSESFDTITLSSAGMVALELPNLSRQHCLYMLEFLYTGNVPLQSPAAAQAAARVAAAQEAEAKRAAAAKERAAADPERISHAAYMAASASSAAAAAPAVAAAAPSPPSSVPAASASVRGLDDDDDDDQSVAGVSTPATAAAAALGSPADGALDVHAALVDLSLRTLGHASNAPPPAMAAPLVNPPLPASFAAHLALYIPVSAAHYDLPRLGSLLERSMRRLLTLSAPEALPTGSDEALGAAPTHMDVLASQLRACVRYDVRAVVQCAQDLLFKHADWLAFKWPGFLAQLPLIFPPDRFSFVAEMERALQQPIDPAETDDPPSMTGCGVAVLQAPHAGASDFVVLTGHALDRTGSLTSTVRMLNTRSLGFTTVPCATPTPNPLPEFLCEHSCAALQSADGAAMHLYSFGGTASVHAHMESNRFCALDLTTLRWAQPSVIGTLPRHRRKHTLTAMPQRERLYLFGGRHGNAALSDLTLFSRRRDGSFDVINVRDDMLGGADVPEPEARFSHTCVYSRAAGGLVVFGGWSMHGPMNDVWLLDVETHQWERKHMHVQLTPTLAQHDALRDADEEYPLPRWGHAAQVLRVNGRECMALMGGIALMQQQEDEEPANALALLNDLWVLDLASWEWRKVRARNENPSRPRHRPGASAEDNEKARDEWEQLLVPSPRTEHCTFARPACAGERAGAAASCAVRGSPLPSSSSSASDQLVVLGGRFHSQSPVLWLDVFDFGSLKWSRERVRPAVPPSAEPVISVAESGCLWQDMQRRFRSAQPMAFAQPRVQTEDVGEAEPGTPAAAASSAPLVASGVDSLQACIRFNLAHEQALCAHRTPLGDRTFVHFLVEGRVLSVPKLIVAARCPLLHTALTSPMRDRELEQLGLIRVEGVRYAVFRAVVYFLYCGDLEFVVPVGAAEARTDRAAGSLNGNAALPRSASSASLSRGVKRNSEELEPDGTGVSAAAAASAPAASPDEEESSQRLSHLQLGGSGDDLLDARLERSFSNSSSATAGSNGSKKHRHSLLPSPSSAAEQPHHPSLDPGTPLPSDGPLPPLPSALSLGGPSASTCVLDPLELLVAADRFQLSSLCGVLEIGLSRQVTSAVVCSFLRFAETYHLAMLKNLCTIFAVEHWEELQGSYPSEYASLSSATRAVIEERLHALAGSHRGPQSRNEPNPLVRTRQSGAAALVADVQAMVGGVLQHFQGVGGGGGGGGGGHAFQEVLAAAAAAVAQMVGQEEEEQPAAADSATDDSDDGEAHNDEDDEDEELAEADAAMFQPHEEDEEEHNEGHP